jgi:hypothetical protein
MKKILALALLLCSFAMLNSCLFDDDDDPVSPSKSSFWKLTGKQYWWMPRDNSNQFGPLVQIPSVPYGTWFHVQGWSYHIGGLEYQLVVTDSAHAGGATATHSFYWAFLPQKMIADTLYPVSAEAQGPNSGGVNITNPGDYTINHPSFSNDWAVAADKYSGKVTGKVKIPKPPDVNNPKKMAILVGVSCAYGVIDYIYIYEWVTE